MNGRALQRGVDSFVGIACFGKTLQFELVTPPGADRLARLRTLGAAVDITLMEEMMIPFEQNKSRGPKWGQRFYRAPIIKPA